VGKRKAKKSFLLTGLFIWSFSEKKEFKMSESVMTEKLLTAKALGEMLSLSKRQVSRLNSCGRIPAPVRIGGSIRWRESDIEQWLSMGCPNQQTFESLKTAAKMKMVARQRRTCLPL
jgi:prophage regulatory protein